MVSFHGLLAGGPFWGFDLDAMPFIVYAPSLYSGLAFHPPALEQKSL